MLKKIVFVFFSSLLVNCLLAKQVSEQDAKHAALQFYSERANQYLSTNHSPFHISGSFVVNKNGLPVYYVFNIDDKGYVIVSADDAVTPVLAYSFEGIYSEENQAPQFTAWMEQYVRQISYARKTDAIPLPAATSTWNHLLNPGNSSSLAPNGTRDVEPMINSDWNQPSPYNEMCPADPAGSNGHAIVGCVPVCMGQIMYYYRWPDHGTGSYTYFDSTYGTQHASFDSTWYQWSNMKNTITASDPGIAQLLYHLGVSVDLRYGPSSSGMYNHKAAYALRTYFKYSPETHYVYRDSTSLNWDSLIIAHLDRKMPLYYAGWSVPNINGHAFVCDGYQGGDYFHFNFGWSGSFNGYFYLDDLTPGGNNFNLAQELIINIYPDTLNYTYPPYCSGSGASALTYDQGSLTDGSGPVHNYLPGADCSWLIDPQTGTDSISKITLTFDRFETSPGDLVSVYDGTDTSAPVLGSYSGTTIPPSVSSTGNKIRITFRSPGGTPAAGWSANYSTTAPVWCSGQKTITADTADITDGSLRFNYHNNSLCRWMIVPASQKKPLTVFFKVFDTEPGKDLLKILDPESHDTLAFISGHYSSPGLPDSVTSPSGKMYIIFSTNSSVTADGFHLYYPKSSIGIIEKSMFTGLKIFPNPVHDLINVDFWCTKETRLKMTLSSIQGQPLSVKSTFCPSGRNQLNIPVSNVPSGIYLLRLQNEESNETYKIVITNQ
ncbi:MAG: T9SS C-terminal target domain-containing protein [Bacteroidetes bacterium]|nr:MAG: T9SS C-terminal target domain-containing protein [Bacteroidota bacterium]